MVTFSGRRGLEASGQEPAPEPPPLPLHFSAVRGFFLFDTFLTPGSLCVLKARSLSSWLSCVPGLLKTPVVSLQLENRADLQRTEREILGTVR